MKHQRIPCDPQKHKIFKKEIVLVCSVRLKNDEEGLKKNRILVEKFQVAPYKLN